MADEQAGKAELVANSDVAAPKLDKDISTWIKNLGAIVTICGVLFGFWQAYHQVLLRAQADTKTAEANQKAEEAKARLGEKQLEAQMAASAGTVKQHQDDLALDYRKHVLDLEVQERNAKDVQLFRDQESLTKLISDLFSKDGNTEANLALLATFAGTTSPLRRVVESAVLAKIENPNSVEAVDIGFRIFEVLGPSAISATVDANRSARQRYNQALLYAYAVSSKQSKPESDPELSFRMATRFVEHGIIFDKGYVEALLFQRTLGGYAATVPSGNVLPMEIIEEMIKRSNIALGRQLKTVVGGHPISLDLSGTYLYLNGLHGEDWASAVAGNGRRIQVNARGAYVDYSDGIGLLSFSGLETLYGLADTTLWKPEELPAFLVPVKFATSGMADRLKDRQ
jgi:hypothetical protein